MMVSRGVTAGPGALISKAPEARGPCAMVNLIGELPEPPAVLAVPGAHLHLYGKTEARAGRKMGHVTFLTG